MTIAAAGLQSEPPGNPRRETKHKLFKPALATKNTNKPDPPMEVLYEKPTFSHIVTKFVKMISSHNH